MTCGDNSKG